MKTNLAILCCVLALHPAAPAQTPPAATKPLDVAVSDEADSYERQLARLEKAAQRYLDLANASTDQKAAAEYLKMYEEKERAIADLRKQGEVERKCRAALDAIHSWQRVAEEAADRAERAANEAAGSEEDPKTLDFLLKAAERELLNASNANGEAKSLLDGNLLCVRHKPEGALELHRLEEQRDRIELSLETIRKFRGR